MGRAGRSVGNRLPGVPGESVPGRKVLPPEQVSVLVFLVGAWLLASFLKNSQQWTEYLDNILDGIEAHDGK